MVKHFPGHLKGDINTLAVNETFNTVYASGVDSRILSIALKTTTDRGDEWMYGQMFRGQSHDIKSLLMINESLLISGGVTTDICVYKLNEGRFTEQFGKDSKHT